MKNLRFVLVAVALLVAAALACGPDRSTPAPTAVPPTAVPATAAPVEPTAAKVETPVPVGESLTVVNDFVLSADITWDTEYGGSGCGFVFRSDGKKDAPSQYLVGASRLANGHVFFAVISQGELVVARDFYANGIDPKSVTWVNIDANAKLAALKAKSIDATTSFYNLHHVYERELGADMGFLVWRDAGLNPYGNSVIVNAKFLAENKPLVDKFVKVTQRAFAACVKDPNPCVQALVDANGALKFDNELVNWSLVEKLMSDKFSREVALGIHDDARMAADYELVREYIGIDKPFDVKSTYTNEFLDRSVKMTK